MRNNDPNPGVDIVAPATTTHSSALIDRIIKDFVAPFLKKAGFRKKGLHFWRDTGDVIDAVTVQKSQWNEPMGASFTIELGLYWKKIQHDLGYLADIGTPKAWDCLIRERIGMIVSGKDLWWEVTPTTDVTSIGIDVVNKLDSKGLSWLVAGHDLTVSYRLVSAYHGPAHSEAFRETLEGRPITPLDRPFRNGFLEAGGQDFDVRTKEGRKAYKDALRKQEKNTPQLVRFAGSDAEYDLRTKEGKIALAQFIEKSKKGQQSAEHPAAEPAARPPQR